jgi:hypothetical protein
VSQCDTMTQKKLKKCKKDKNCQWIIEIDGTNLDTLTRL